MANCPLEGTTHRDANRRGSRLIMKRTLRFTASFGLTMLSLTGVLGSGGVFAQQPRFLKQHTSVPSCGCGQWTCPACQQQTACQPSNNGTVNQTPPAQTMSPSDSSNSGGTANARDTEAAPLSGIDYSQIASNSRSNPLQQNAGSNNYLNNAIEFQGDYFGGQVYSFNGTLIPSSSNGQLKLAENVSPLPRDRIFFNYSLFNRVPLTPGGIDVNRFSPGFEKTFFDKQASLEIRTPFATTLDSDIFTDGSTSTNNLQFGNLFFTLKGILIGGDDWAITGGTSLVLPTAQDSRVLDSDGDQILQISNQSVHLMPFLGAMATPTANTYIQSIVQIDTPLNGNSVFETTDFSNVITETKVGKLTDFTMIYFDVATGFWLYRAPSNSSHGILGVIPTLEFHWNQSLTRADSVVTTQGSINGTVTQFQNLNITSGVTFQLPRKTRLALGYVVPIGNSQDQLFNSELRVMLNRFF